MTVVYMGKTKTKSYPGADENEQMLLRSLGSRTKETSTLLEIWKKQPEGFVKFKESSRSFNGKKKWDIPPQPSSRDFEIEDNGPASRRREMLHQMIAQYPRQQLI